MRSSSREEIVDALEADYKRALDLTFDVLTAPERLAVLESLEQMRRSQPAVEHVPVADQPRRSVAAHSRGRRPR
jgi:hypothetical protein